VKIVGNERVIMEGKRKKWLKYTSISLKFGRKKR
jgi:hypothetical protein